MNEEPESEALHLLGSVMDTYKLLMSAALRADGEPLGLMEAHILRIIHAAGGCTQLEVVRETRRDKAQIGKLVRNLVDRDLVARATDSSDARRQRLVLTIRGDAVAIRALGQRSAIARQLFKMIPEDELGTFLELLRVLDASTKAADPPSTHSVGKPSGQG